MDIILNKFVALHTIVLCAFGTCMCASINFLSSFSQVMSFFATAEHEKERLQYFASPEGRDDIYKYNQKERRTVLEVSFGEYIICALSSNFNLWLEWLNGLYM